MDLSQFGLRPLKDAMKHLENYSLIPTGVPHFDIMFGGIKSPGINTIFGAKETCKSTIALMICGNYQRLFDNSIVIYADFEGNATDPQRVNHFIHDPERFLFLDVQAGESAEEAFGRLCRAIGNINKHYNDVPILVVIDSIGAMVTAKELNNEGAIAGVARMLSGELKRIMSLMLKPRSSIVAINQYRESISPYHRTKYFLVGGHILQHLSSRLVRLRGNSKRERDFVKHEITLIDEKSRPPSLLNEIRYIMKTSISRVEIENVDEAILYGLIRAGIVEQHQAFYDLDGQRYRGREAVMNVIKEHRQEYYERILNAYDKILEGRLAKQDDRLLIPQLEVSYGTT